MSGQVMDTEYPGGVSNQDIKQQAIARAAAASTFDFPTEIVDLPSKGLLYAIDSPLSSGKVEMKYMTAREEDILTNPTLISQGKALDKLFQALIVGNGDGMPVNAAELTLGDKNAVMIAARVLGYGPEYAIKVNVPGTGESFSHTVDLTEIANAGIDESLYNNTNRFEFVLPIGKQVIEYKILTSDEEVEIANLLEKQALRGHSKGITTRLKYQILSVNGNADKSYVDKFIDNELIARDSLQLRTRIAEITPDIDLTVQVDNAEYNYSGRVMLPIGLDFFWPGA